MAQAALEDLGAGELAARITPYRAGYTSEQRREIERRLAAGELRAVVTTDALELGNRRRRPRRSDRDLLPRHRRQPPPDVGPRRPARPRPRGLHRRRRRPRPVLRPPPPGVPRPARRGRDPRPRIRGDPPPAPASAPPTRARSTRSPTPSSSVPGSRPTPSASSGPATSAARRPAASIRRGRLRRPPPRALPRRRGLAPLRLRRALRDHRGPEPARSSASDDASRAYSTLHDGAVYLHMGARYLVRGLDLELREALVEPFDGDYYTQPKTDSEPADRAAARPPRDDGGDALLRPCRSSPRP